MQLGYANLQTALADCRARFGRGSLARRTRAGSREGCVSPYPAPPRPKAMCSPA